MDNSDIMFQSTSMDKIIYTHEYQSQHQLQYIFKKLSGCVTLLAFGKIIVLGKMPRITYFWILFLFLFFTHDKWAQIDNNRCALDTFTQGETTIQNSLYYTVKDLWQSLTFNRSDVILFHYFNLREHLSQFRDAFILIAYPLLFLLKL